MGSWGDTFTEQFSHDIFIEQQHPTFLLVDNSAVNARRSRNMRLSFGVAFSTWLLALTLRIFALAYLGTAQNPRAGIPPLLNWMGTQSGEIPMATAIAVLIVMFVMIAAWWRLHLTSLAATGLGLFVGGGAANTTEQLVYGSVTDYIPISLEDDFLANFADVTIVAGALLLTVALVHSAMLRHRTHRAKRRP